MNAIRFYHETNKADHGTQAVALVRSITGVECRRIRINPLTWLDVANSLGEKILAFRLTK